MSALPFARMVARAEVLCLRLRARRWAVGLILVLIGMILACAALAFLHIAAWLWASERLGPRDGALAIGGADVVLAAALCAWGLCRGPSRAERDARAVRDAAAAGLRASLTPSAGLFAWLFGLARTAKPPD